MSDTPPRDHKAEQKAKYPVNPRLTFKGGGPGNNPASGTPEAQKYKPRTKIERERDMVLLVKLYCAGVPQFQIAERLGVNPKIVANDLAFVRALWLSTIKDQLDQLKADQLVKLDNLEREYAEAWLRSREIARAKSTRLEHEGGELTKRIKNTRAEYRDGNPAFLDGILKVIDRRCKLLGLDPADAASWRNADGDEIKAREEWVKRVVGNDEANRLAHQLLEVAYSNGDGDRAERRALSSVATLDPPESRPS